MSGGETGRLGIESRRGTETTSRSRGWPTTGADEPISGLVESGLTSSPSLASRYGVEKTELAAEDNECELDAVESMLPIGTES